MQRLLRCLQTNYIIAVAVTGKIHYKHYCFNTAKPIWNKNFTLYSKPSKKLYNEFPFTCFACDTIAANLITLITTWSPIHSIGTSLAYMCLSVSIKNGMEHRSSCYHLILKQTKGACQSCIHWVSVHHWKEIKI